MLAPTVKYVPRSGSRPVGVDDSQGTSYASHIDPSRSAIAGTLSYLSDRRRFETQPHRGLQEGTP